MWDVLSRPFVLILIASIGYGAATIGMKAASTSVSLFAILAIAVCLAAAVLAEVVLLRQVHLGLAYVVILGVETVLVLITAYALGEGLGPRQMTGAMLVLIGAGVISI